MTAEGIGNLNLNVNVTIFSPDIKAKDLSSKIYKGRIYHRDLDRSVVIELEESDGAEAFIIGKQILLFLAHDLGLYIFSTLVNHKYVKDGITFLHCTDPQQVKYFQRRKAVRVQVSVPASFSAEFNRSKVWDGTITDMSIGGLQMEAPFSIPVGSVLELIYQLEDIGPVFMDGRVIRSFENEGHFVHGLEFVNPDQHCLDGIARYVMAEQLRQKRLGLQIFKAFILRSTIETHASTVFSIIQFRDLDISALYGKKCSGMINEIGIYELKMECPLKLPIGAVLEFSFELPKIGYSTIQATVRNVSMHAGKFLIVAEFVTEYEKLRDCILENLASDFAVPFTDTL